MLPEYLYFFANIVVTVAIVYFALLQATQTKFRFIQMRVDGFLSLFIILAFCTTAFMQSLFHFVIVIEIFLCLPTRKVYLEREIIK